jgi:hypothetical protein
VNLFDDIFRAHRLEFCLGLFVVAVLAVIALLKRRFASAATAWPTVPAKIENVFLDGSSRGPNRNPETHAVLAYAYSVSESCYSGEVRLWASGLSLDLLERELIGQQITIQYNPRNPQVSIFLKHKIRGWLVVKDRRLSLLAWFENI